MELIQVKGDTWRLEGMELIPLYRLDERRCILLDSGWSWERETLRQALEREKLLPVGILGTHAHHDHAGNHMWLRERYGVRICMSAGGGRAGGPRREEGQPEFRCPQSCRHVYGRSGIPDRPAHRPGGRNRPFYGSTL